MHDTRDFHLGIADVVDDDVGRARNDQLTRHRPSADAAHTRILAESGDRLVYPLFLSQRGRKILGGDMSDEVVEVPLPETTK